MTKENKNNNKIRDRIIMAVLIIIIIILLIHNCSLLHKKGTEEEKVNIIDITCNSSKCEKQTVNSIDCLKSINSKQCLVPDFKGKTKNELLKWLSSISNTIEIEIKLVEDPNNLDGTIISQSVVGTSVKDLLDGKVKLVITIVNNGSLVDCLKDINNNKCLLPDFISKTTNDVEEWINGIANHINIKYIYVDLVNQAGTITNQSIKSGTSVKEIIDNNQTLLIYISKGKQVSPDNPDTSTLDPDPTPTPEPEPEPEPEIDEDFYVSDNEIVKWQDETSLNIFEDSSNISKVKGKIAPESSGTYKFVVNNGTKYNLNYKISFSETNEHGINMKYKLKKGDNYIVNNYVSYNELNIEDVLLNTKNSDTYYLEWKWVGDNDDNDTQIGTNAKSSNIKYDLKITVEAESVQ